MRKDKHDPNFPSKEAQANMLSPFLTGLFFSAVKSLVLYRIMEYARVTTMEDAVAVSIWLYVAFIASSQVPTALWADRPAALILVFFLFFSLTFLPV